MTKQMNQSIKAALAAVLMGAVAVPVAVAEGEGEVQSLRANIFPDYPGDDDGCYSPREGCFTVTVPSVGDGEYDLTFDNQCQGIVRAHWTVAHSDRTKPNEGAYGTRNFEQGEEVVRTYRRPRAIKVRVVYTGLRWDDVGFVCSGKVHDEAPLPSNLFATEELKDKHVRWEDVWEGN